MEAYFNTASCHTNKIVLQRRALRTLYFLDYTINTDEYFMQSSLLKLEDVYSYLTCIYVYKALNGNSAEFNVFSSLDNLADRHGYGTRNNKNIVVPNFRKTKTQFSIEYCGVKLWNKLPEAIRSLSSLAEFKKSLKIYLTRNYIG